MYTSRNLGPAANWFFHLCSAYEWAKSFFNFPPYLPGLYWHHSLMPSILSLIGNLASGSKLVIACPFPRGLNSGSGVKMNARVIMHRARWHFHGALPFSDEEGGEGEEEALLPPSLLELPLPSFANYDFRFFSLYSTELPFCFWGS